MTGIGPVPQVQSWPWHHPNPCDSEMQLGFYLKSRLTGDARDTTAGMKFETVDELKNHLREIFSKTVGQLIGELSNEFQRKNESVLTYVNRLRKLVSQIYEANKLATNAGVTTTFKDYVNNTLIDCFRAGLKPEITPRLKTSNDVEEIVKDAIHIEKEIQRNKLLSERENYGNRRIVQVCDLSNRSMPESIPCGYCGINGHTAVICRKRLRDASKPEACQICKRTNHITSQCSTIIKCQVCNRTGHTARDCKNRPPSITCQLCNKPGHTANYC